MVRVPGSTSLNVTTGLTLSAWIQPTVAQGSWRTIMQSEAEAYFLNASNGNGDLLPSGGGMFGPYTIWLSGDTPSPVGAWTHVAMTYDGTILRLFVNGVQASTAAADGPIETSNNPLWIGGNQLYGEFFNGLIDDARVYNRPLSATELQTDMNTPLTWSGLPSGTL